MIQINEVIFTKIIQLKPYTCLDVNNSGELLEGGDCLLLSVIGKPIVGDNFCTILDSRGKDDDVGQLLDNCESDWTRF